MNTLGLANGFNDLRYMEVRNARHMTRSPGYLQAVAIRSMANRYNDISVSLVDVTPESMTTTTGVHVAESVYQAEESGLTKDALGLDPKVLMDGGFPTSKTDAFSRHALPLLHVLLKTAREDWGRLWMAQLMRPGMVFVDLDTNH